MTVSTIIILKKFSHTNLSYSFTVDQSNNFHRSGSHKIAYILHKNDKTNKPKKKKTCCTTDQSFKIPSTDFQLQTSLTTEESVRLKDSSASAPRVKSLITPIPSIHPIYRIATHLLNTFWPCLDFPSPLISPDSFPLSPHFLRLFLFSFFFLYFSFH